MRDRPIGPVHEDRFWPCSSCQRWFDNSETEVVGTRIICRGCLEEE